MRTLLIAFLASLAFLPGCAQISKTIAKNEAVRVLVPEDLEAALVDATIHKDTASARCWETLLSRASRAKQAREAVTTKTGLFYELQLTRNWNNFYADPEVQSACAPILVDIQGSLVNSILLLR